MSGPGTDPLYVHASTDFPGLTSTVASLASRLISTIRGSGLISAASGSFRSASQTGGMSESPARTLVAEAADNPIPHANTSKRHDIMRGYTLSGMNRPPTWNTAVNFMSSRTIMSEYATQI